MKTSFSTLACPHWNLSQTVTAAARYGYDGVELRVLSGELDLWKLPEFAASALNANRRMISDAGIVIPCLDSSACFHSADLEERERNLDSALRMAGLAAGLGVKAIRVFGDRIQPGANRQETMGWIRDSLARLTNRLRPEKIAVWLETHGDFAASSDVGELLSPSDLANVGVIWDPANAYEQNDEGPQRPSFAERIRHVHLKDLIRDENGASHYVLPGDGAFPFEVMFASLEEMQFSGFVSFEWEKQWHPELADPEIALPRFIRWWNSRQSA